MPIRYNVATLLKEPVGSTREYELEGQVLMEEDSGRTRPLAGHATFLRTEQGVLVTARLRGVEGEQCSRCLREFDLPVSLEIEEEFFARVDAETGATTPPPEDPEVFLIDADHTLDMDEAVRQYWAMALPMQPLCRPDCRGLCPRCGQNLNEGACACPPEEDDRWSALRELAPERKGG